MRAIIYLRVSTAEQAKSGLGLAAQLRSCRLWCEAMGHVVVDEIADEGVTTRLAVEKRLGLTRAMVAVRRGDADLIVAASTNRISRDTVEFLSMLKTGVPLMALDLGIDPTTAVGRFVATIMAATGQLERDVTSERTVAALAEISAQGRPLGARAHRVPVLVDQSAIDRMRALKADGRTLRDIATMLDYEGYRTPRGGHWSHSTVASILRRAA